MSNKAVPGGGNAANPGVKTWFPYVKARADARLRLVCFPFAGGTASSMQRWAEQIPGVEVLAAQYPGRETRFGETPFRDVRTMAAALGPVVRSLADRPFAFFGYSMGTLVAVEVTRWLLREGAPLPVGLLVAAGTPPGRRKVRPLYALPEKEFIEALERYGGTPPQVLAHKDLMEMLAPMLRADFEIVDTYKVIDESPLPLPLSAFAGDADPHAMPDVMEGWKDLTSKDFSFQVFPGEHFFIHSAAEALREAIERSLLRWCP
ncbi:alpha/beta fold hydrolase [Stigmatella sp. ncwal1]|uniref:Alpha/beta fold hydrolase n=1 Tax=Stigmatella ashevillensis TaxID=2995309 RepID=A0ABT5D8Y2_9BACT|nr:alpha/beta fold hydrolase [Stigmatella ashevillena]MDC0710140.1 alpha/beta fold hydrolase [Stigmatella ashevillena]